MGVQRNEKTKKKLTNLFLHHIFINRIDKNFTLEITMRLTQENTLQCEKFV